MPKHPGFVALRKAVRQALREDRGVARDEVASGGRREFLKRAALWGGALGAAGSPLGGALARRAWANLRRPVQGRPVIVIGGGLAGLTAAYRLARSGARVSLYEAQGRLGGRVFTHDRFNAEGMFCELGGELIDTTHGAILGLASELGLHIDDFRPGDASVRKHEYFFGGRRYFDEELTAACAPLARRLAADMRKVFTNPSEPGVTYNHFTPAAARFDRISLQEYLESMSDVEGWVRDGVNMAYLTEYGLDTGEQSSINLMMMIDPSNAGPDGGFGIYGESDEALRIRGGNSRLVEALARAFEAHGGAIHLRQRLVRMEDRGPVLELTFDDGGRANTVTAPRAVCTVPFSVLRDVEGLEALSPVKRRCIAELGYGQNTKHMLGFKERRWRTAQSDLPAASGYTFTDLPSQTLWESSRAQAGRSGILTVFMGGRNAVDPGLGSVDALLGDVERIFPGTRTLHDGNHVQFRWPDHPWSRGSYTCPRVGQYTTIIGSPKEPELAGKLLFAGEHVSERFQGYMNGAVDTANAAASAALT